MNEKRSVCFRYERGFLIRGKCWFCEFLPRVFQEREGGQNLKPFLIPAKLHVLAFSWPSSWWEFHLENENLSRNYYSGSVSPNETPARKKANKRPKT